MKEKYEAIARSVSDRTFEYLMEIQEDYVGESEIESLLSFRFLAEEMLPVDYQIVSYSHQGVGTNFQEVIRFMGRDDLASNNTAYIFQQVDANRYRLDFLLSMRMRNMRDEETRKKSLIKYLAIECDGHDFHEKTKEQAIRDKSRDRFLLINGIPSMRFTGSEIWNDVNKCFRQVDEFFYNEARNFFELARS